ncbi:hypothetical protein CLCR_11245 [Cladophialophora carrionii]|uniref:Uncharacterized protein n=1 Tax=Cladophialophora carrionii TaxID=86049 RepID=A0A1C1CCZ0_9EURO|nr:hypothetical protein CLCR_11245 [Cladophialophora carrionii]
MALDLTSFEEVILATPWERGVYQCLLDKAGKGGVASPLRVDLELQGFDAIQSSWIVSAFEQHRAEKDAWKGPQSSGNRAKSDVECSIIGTSRKAWSQEPGLLVSSKAEYKGSYQCAFPLNCIALQIAGEMQILAAMSGSISNVHRYSIVTGYQPERADEGRELAKDNGDLLRYLALFCRTGFIGLTTSSYGHQANETGIQFVGVAGQGGATMSNPPVLRKGGFPMTMVDTTPTIIPLKALQFVPPISEFHRISEHARDQDTEWTQRLGSKSRRTQNLFV